MNIQQVLRTYSLLRQLTDDESALLETLRGLNDAERESLVTALLPEKATTKRASKKSSKGGSKSLRASGMAAAIKGNLESSRKLKDARCAYYNSNGLICDTTEDNPIHDPAMGYAGYHEFDAGKSDAQPARVKSSTNGGAGSATQNIETKREGAGVAVGGLNE